MDNQYDDEIIKINFRKISHALKSNFLVVFLIALIVTAAAFAVSKFFIPPKYRAVASMYVNNTNIAFGTTSLSISESELSASNSLVEAYLYLLNSRTTLEAVIADTGVDYSIRKLQKRIIKAEGVPKTAAFEVTVTSKSAEEAELIANSIAKILPERISQTIDGTYVRIIDYAVVPIGKYSPNLLLISAIALVGTMFIAAIVVVVKCITGDMQNDIIENIDDFKKKYPRVHVLAVIPDMSLAGGKGYYYSSYYGADKKHKKGEK